MKPNPRFSKWLALPVLLIAIVCSAQVKAATVASVQTGDWSNTATWDCGCVLGAGDTLQITVYDQADLTGSYRISDSGFLAIPIVGAIPAQGLTLDQLQKRLTERLDAKAVKSPDVTLQLEAIGG